MYLVDTNVISEARRGSAEATRWLRSADPHALYLSVITLGEIMRASIYESLQHLILFPFIGRQQKERGVRKFVMPRFGYLIYYTINEAEEEIVILGVKHSAQRPEHDDM